MSYLVELFQACQFSPLIHVLRLFKLLYHLYVKIGTLGYRIVRDIRRAGWDM